MQFVRPKDCLASSSNNIIFKVINLFCTLMFGITILLLLTSKVENFTRPWMFIVAIILAIGFAWIHSKMKECPSRKWIFFLSFLFSIFQIVIVQSYLFETGWDVWTLLRAAESTAYGTEWLPWFDIYFSTYPNNCLITAFYSFLFRIFSVDPPILIIVCINCILSGLASYLLYRTVCIIKDDHSGVIVWFLYWLILGLSPWISITYSDPLVIIFPILSFYLYFYDKRIIQTNNTCSVSFCAKHIICIILIFFISGVGYQIKPQTLIPAIAVFICLFVQNLFLRNYRMVGIDCIAALLGIAMSVVVCNMISTIPMLTLNEGASFSPSHWIMMGLNPDSLGRYSESDVNFSKSFLTQAERWDGNFEVIWSRLSDYGFLGYLQLLKNKLTICMGDGTFYWAKNCGPFFEVVYPYNSPLSELTKAFYYTDGEHYSLFHDLSNVLWVFLLVSIFIGQVLHLIKKQKNDEYTVVYLTLLGLIAFELIFEVFPRHLYSFAPVFILVAEHGISNLKFIIFNQSKNTN